MDKPIKKELAIWAKGKGFDFKVHDYYDIDSVFVDNYGYRENHNDKKFSELGKVFYSAPTHEELKHWIYDQFGIWISVERYLKHYRYKIQRDIKVSIFKFDFKSPTEALESALDYIKENNLI